MTDEEALKFAEVAHSFQAGKGEDIYAKVISFLKSKNQGDIDILEVRKIKGLIRRMESLGAIRYFGLPDENVSFMDLPFYETGKIMKNPLGEEDVKITKDLIKKIKPHQIYAAGDLADPHGTHKVCLDAIFSAIQNLKNESFMKICKNHI